MDYICKLCGVKKESLGPVPDELCDGCWELKIRIETQPDLAKKVLHDMEADNEGIS